MIVSQEIFMTTITNDITFPYLWKQLDKLVIYCYII